jgi:hypothetical protein
LGEFQIVNYVVNYQSFHHKKDKLLRFLSVHISLTARLHVILSGFVG